MRNHEVHADTFSNPYTNAEHGGCHKIDYVYYNQNTCVLEGGVCYEKFVLGTLLIDKLLR